MPCSPRTQRSKTLRSAASASPRRSTSSKRWRRSAWTPTALCAGVLCVPVAEGRIGAEALAAGFGADVATLIAGVQRMDALATRSPRPPAAPQFRQPPAPGREPAPHAGVDDRRSARRAGEARRTRAGAARARCGRGRARRGPDRARGDGHLCAARAPPRRGPDQVGARGSRVPPPAARRLPRHREAARRAARRSRAVHRRRDRAPARGAGRGGREGRALGPPEAPLQHLAQDAAQGHRHHRGLRRARAARAGRLGGRLLLDARHRARAVAQPPRRVRRLHRQPQAERLPLAAHRGDRRRRQGAGGADPHRRHAPGGRARHLRALVYKGGERRGRGQRLRGQDRLAAPGARLGRRARCRAN